MVKMFKEYFGFFVNLVIGIFVLDLIVDGFDVVICVGVLQDFSFFFCCLGLMLMVLCVVKSYLVQVGNLEKLVDFVGYVWLEYSVWLDNEFVIIVLEGILICLILQGCFVINDFMMLVCWLIVGVGIVYVFLMWVIEEINCGEFEILLFSYQFDL